ncbi:MAG: tRNA dimethylallyltransferase, partial [Rikenellaceae bacterium]
EGLQPLLSRLKELDPTFYDVVDRHNHKRVIRALEVCLTSGKPYSEQRIGAGKQRDFAIRKIGIEMPRELLYDRINRRVDLMIDQGMEVEARSVYCYREYNALRTVGYNEMFDYFDDKISFDEAVSKIKQNTRRYAKRQLTWFGRDDTIEWIKNIKQL